MGHGAACLGVVVRKRVIAALRTEGDGEPCADTGSELLAGGLARAKALRSPGGENREVMGACGPAGDIAAGKFGTEGRGSSGAYGCPLAVCATQMGAGAEQGDPEGGTCLLLVQVEDEIGRDRAGAEEEETQAGSHSPTTISSRRPHRAPWNHVWEEEEEGGDLCAVQL